MTKKTLTVYSMLFLFAFTFGLSFTLASSAQAEQRCCVILWCPGDPSQPALEGWKDPYSHECEFNPSHPECMAYICDET